MAIVKLKKNKEGFYFKDALNFDFEGSEDFNDFLGFVPVSKTPPNKQNDSRYPPSIIKKDPSKILPELNSEEWLLWLTTAWILYFFEDFEEFVGTGADNVQVDLIFTSLEELIESEIGRSMHENRIFEQRKQQRFQNNILINIEYIIEYLFAVGMSPTVQIDGIPIKIWGRYLPDTLSYNIRKLYRMPEYSLVGL